MDDVGLIHLWHLLAGLLGALGNQVIYWSNRLRQPDLAINRRMIPVSAAYVFTGGGIGFFVGVSTGQTMDLVLFSLGSGAFWPETLKALDAARQTSLLIRKKLNEAVGSPGSPEEGAG